jgi:hypothetical protein
MCSVFPSEFVEVQVLFGSQNQLLICNFRLPSSNFQLDPTMVGKRRAVEDAASGGKAGEVQELKTTCSEAAADIKELKTVCSSAAAEIKELKILCSDAAVEARLLRRTVDELIKKARARGLGGWFQRLGSLVPDPGSRNHMFLGTNKIYILFTRWSKLIDSWNQRTEPTQIDPISSDRAVGDCGGRARCSCCCCRPGRRCCRPGQQQRRCSSAACAGAGP